MSLPSTDLPNRSTAPGDARGAERVPAAALAGVDGPASGAGLFFGTAMLMLAMAGSTFPSPFYPVWQQQLGVGALFMTVVFALYPLVLLATLLTLGSLSDHLGRRPVASLALLLLAVASALFAWWQDPAGLVVARCIQGVGVGLAMSALGAYTAELAPPRLAGLGTTLNAAGPTAGLALGAVVAGGVLDLVAGDAWVRPGPLLFGLATAAFVAGAAGIWRLPETSPRRPGVIRSLRPSVHVHGPVRAEFLRSIPGITATWATGSLFISLGATIIGTVFHTESHVVQGLSVGVLAGVGTVATIGARRVNPQRTAIIGPAALLLGTALGVFAVAQSMLPLYFAGLVITGCGFGLTYASALRVILPLAPAAERAGVFAAIYVVAYLSFGIPAVVAGVLTSRFGIGVTATGYGIAVIGLAAVALGLALRGRVRSEG